MADEDKTNEEDDTEAKPKSKLKLIIAAVVVLLVLAGGGGGAYWYFMMSDDEAAQAADGEEVVEEEHLEAIYHLLRPVFTTTFSANGRQRYMQVEVTLVTRSEEVVAAIITHQPLIRNALVMLFADADYLELQTPAGKEALRAAAIETVDNILVNEAAQSGVEKVLFTQFVMQ